MGIPDGPVSRDRVRESAVPFDRIPFDHQHCFLCGVELSETNRSDEHVFPRWLQARYDLWNQEITLLNGTSIRYRQLTVPCCRDCNTGPLARLEDEIRIATEGGHAAVKALAPIRVFQWAAKILIGILFKEIDLLIDRSAADSPTIIPPSHLDDFSSLHDVLQSVRVPATFVGGPFFSVLVAPIHELDGWRPFDFADSVDDEVVGIRLTNVGIIVSLADGGLSEEHWSKILGAFGDHPLHPIQFDEMLAHVVALKQRITRPIRMMMAANAEDGSDLTFVRLGGFSLAPLVADFDPDRLKFLLRHYLGRWGAATESIWTREGAVGTTIFESEGRVGLCDKNFDLVRSVPYE